MASAPSATVATRPDYGLDAPGVVRNLLLGAAALLAIRIVTGVALVSDRAAVLQRIGVGLGWAGAGLAIGGVLMVLSSRVGKLRLRDRLLDGLHLAPTARVLDVGCGHGLLLVGAARRTPEGEAVGLDLWSQKDQRANSREATLANARLEGVAERVTVEDGDMRALPFPDASFDAVVSCLAIHNVHGRDERRRAIGEIARVLRPGGQVAIVDIAHVRAYAEDLRAAGFTTVRAPRLTPLIYPPARVLTAVK